MNELEFLKELLSSAESLAYGEYDKAELIKKRALMAISNIFGEDSNYFDWIWKIAFDLKYKKKAYEEEVECAWYDGQKELVHLLKVITEDYEVFKLPSISNTSQYNSQEDQYEGLLYTITKFFSQQESTLDKNISFLLNYSELSVLKGSIYSNRPYCYWATAVIKTPSKIKNKFNDPISKRILGVLNEFRPIEWDIDFFDIAIQPKFEKAYDSWRDDILKKLTGEGINNQAIFKSSSYPMFELNGVKFRSKSEKTLVPFFEQAKVLYFPLPLAICGNERKEPDFLVCQKGKWAVLEVVNDHFHPSVEKEADRTNWFQNHHVQIRSYSSKRCIETPNEVVKEFLKWLDGLPK